MAPLKAWREHGGHDLEKPLRLGQTEEPAEMILAIADGMATFALPGQVVFHDAIHVGPRAMKDVERAVAWVVILQGACIGMDRRFEVFAGRHGKQGRELLVQFLQHHETLSLSEDDTIF